MADTPFDCIIIGAGYAGLAAARDLTAAGAQVCVFEAGQRVGGRAHAELFPGTSTRVDWGAEWVLPDHHHALMAEASRHQITVEEADGSVPPLWRMPGGNFAGDVPALMAARPSIARLLAALESHAAVAPPEADTQSWGEWLSAADPADAAFLDAAVFPLTGAHPSEVAMSMLLNEIRFHGGSVMETLQPQRIGRLAGGADSVAKAMAECMRHGVIRFECTVEEINEADGIVTVAGPFGRASARSLIVALPLNVLSRLQWRPALPEPLAGLIQDGHGGRTIKLWALGKTDVPLAECFSAQGPFRLTYARPADEGRVLVCAQALSNELEDRSANTVAGIFETCFPRLSVEHAIIRDWVEEPLARGSWHAGRPGQAAAMEMIAARDGRIRFCGGDFASLWSGWMEGALLSGSAAAAAVAARLA